MCKTKTADIEDGTRKQDADVGMGVSIVLAKGFEAQHCFGLTHNICTCAVSVKGFAFGGFLMPNLQHPGKLEAAQGVTGRSFSVPRGLA